VSDEDDDSICDKCGVPCSLDETQTCEDCGRDGLCNECIDPDYHDCEGEEEW
jgi:hypothetical protein